MEAILNFLVDNYLWFLIISLILVFGLIGYIVDSYEKKSPKLHFGSNDDINAEGDISSEPKTLKELLDEQNNEKINDSEISEEAKVLPENTEETKEETELPEE